MVPDADGRCLQFDRRSRLCAVHREHGEDSLPASCYQFPRRALIDDRGTFVTLSHYCPTAATLLYDGAGPIAIVAGPQAFPESRRYEGLDARGQWPPLVKHDLLFDLESYSRWEDFIVSTFARDYTVENALNQLASTAERLRHWAPACGRFDAWVDAAIEQSIDGEGRPSYERFRTIEAYHEMRRFVANGLNPPPEPVDALNRNGYGDHMHAARRYLASKAFASWSAYETMGVRALIAELYAAELVLRVECARACQTSGRSLDRALMIEAIRQSDLLLIHLIDRPRMIDWLDVIERE